MQVDASENNQVKWNAFTQFALCLQFENSETLTSSIEILQRQHAHAIICFENIFALEVMK